MCPSASQVGGPCPSFIYLDSIGFACLSQRRLLHLGHKAGRCSISRGIQICPHCEHLRTETLTVGNSHLLLKNIYLNGRPNRLTCQMSTYFIKHTFCNVPITLVNSARKCYSSSKIKICVENSKCQILQLGSWSGLFAGFIAGFLANWGYAMIMRLLPATICRYPANIDAVKIDKGLQGMLTIKSCS